MWHPPPSICLVLPAALFVVAGASGPQASGGKLHEVRVYDAYVEFGEYGAAIADQTCLFNGIPILIAPALQGGRFDRILRYGGGRLRAANKYVVVDALVDVPDGVMLEDLP